MGIGRAGSAVVVFLIGAFAASSALAQTVACPKQSATGHVEIIGSVRGVNLGRHIVYSFSAIQQEGEVDADGHCVVNGQIQEFLYGADPGGDLEKRAICCGARTETWCASASDPIFQRPGQASLLGR